MLSINHLTKKLKGFGIERNVSVDKIFETLKQNVTIKMGPQKYLKTFEREIYSMND